jgi:hypothetical protein
MIHSSYREKIHNLYSAIAVLSEDSWAAEVNVNREACADFISAVVNWNRSRAINPPRPVLFPSRFTEVSNRLEALRWISSNQTGVDVSEFVSKFDENVLRALELEGYLSVQRSRVLCRVKRDEVSKIETYMSGGMDCQ